MLGRYNIAISGLLLLPVAWVGCATTDVLTCMQTAASSKVSDQAVGSCRKAVEQAPANSNLFAHYARMLVERGEYQALLQLGTETTARDPSRSDALYFCAVALRKLGRYDAAIARYQRYAQRRPSDPDPYYGMALSWEAQGKPLAASQAYQQYLSQEKRPAYEAWKARARQRLTALSGVASGSRRSRFATLTSRASPLGPAGPTSSAATATRAKLSRRRRPSRPTRPEPKTRPLPTTSATGSTTPTPRAPTTVDPSCRAAEKTVAANPFDTAAYDRLVACAVQQQKHRTILKRMRTALRDNPDYARGWLHLGRAYHALGQNVASANALAKACAKGIEEACNRAAATP